MEAQRDQRGLTWLEDLARDVRFACRTLRKAPGFTVVGVLTLALGIGANSAMFSVINAVLLRPLPFPSPDRLAAVGSIELRPVPGAVVSSSASWPDFFDWRSRAREFEHLSAYRETGFTLADGTSSRIESYTVPETSSSPARAICIRRAAVFTASPMMV